MSCEIRYLGDPSRHFWMTRSVARALGLNLSDAMDRGLLGVQDYADMVTKCRQCPHIRACEAWLAQTAAGGAESPPIDCMIRDTFGELTAAMRA